jgi:hypothetical protein
MMVGVSWFDLVLGFCAGIVFYSVLEEVLTVLEAGRRAQGK